MKYIILLLGCLFVFSACKTKKQESKSIIDDYHSSHTDIQKSKFEYLYYSLIDSLRRVPAPKEKSESKGLQYSKLQTSFSISIAFIDSIGKLHHNIENKDSIDQPIRYIQDKQSKHDTIYINRTDTLRLKEYEYIHVQEEPSFLEKTRRSIGDIAMGIVLIALIIFGIKRALKK